MERDIKERKHSKDIKTRSKAPKRGRPAAWTAGHIVTRKFREQAAKRPDDGSPDRTAVDSVEQTTGESVRYSYSVVRREGIKHRQAAKQRKAETIREKPKAPTAEPRAEPPTPEQQMRRAFLEQKKQDAKAEKPNYGGSENPLSHSSPLDRPSADSSGKNLPVIREKVRTGPAIREKPRGGAVIKTKQSVKAAAPKLSTPAKAPAKKTVKGFAAHGRRKAQREAQRQAVTVTKKTVKAAASLAKKAAVAVAKAVAALISAIAGIVGGAGLLLILCVVVVILGLAASPFGIFFSGDTEPEGRNMRVVMREINMEFSDRLTAIESANPHDVLDCGGTSASWKDVLAIYTVKHSTESAQPIEVATLTPEKEEYLRTVFWDMNQITYDLEVREGEATTEDGTEVTETRILHIRIRGLTQTEIAVQYGFSERQMAQLAELIDTQFDDAWRNLLYGSSGGGGDIVAVALSQVGNVGGQTYWSWYGFGGKVDWCACFVSWCAANATGIGHECGYIDAGIIPKFSGCTSQGMAWFQARGQWADRSYTPNPGDLIFFDWDSSGDADHVGIVERVENGTIYTVEGNSGSPDAVRQQNYPVGWRQIRGYGIPMY